jgi:hypothetical protein
MVQPSSGCGDTVFSSQTAPRNSLRGSLLLEKILVEFDDVVALLHLNAHSVLDHQTH